VRKALSRLGRRAGLLAFWVAAATAIALVDASPAPPDARPARPAAATAPDPRGSPQQPLVVSKPDARDTSQQPLVVSIPPDSRGTPRQPLVVSTPTELRWTIGLTVATILVLVGQGIAFAVQAHRLKQSVDATQLATQATLRIAQTEQQTVRRRLKAYVFVADHSFEHRAEFRANVIIRNFGQTPAYRFHMSLDTVISKEFSEPAESEEPPALGTLGPGAPFTAGASVRMSTSDYQAIQAGRLRLYVFGKVTYEDAFGNANRWMTFRLMTRTGPNWAKLISCPDGNDSDPPEEDVRT
jgi:hypothetical protein